MNYLKKNAGLISTVILLIICFFIYVPNLSNYPLIDTNETKLVSIAKEMLNNSDWINIKLNGENIFNIPPLFFWIINFSCLILGKISIEAVRLPISIISILGILGLFYGIKKILTKTYAFIISLIMATSFGTIIFSRLATTDILFTVITMTIFLFSYMAIFAKSEKSTTKYWVGIYTFTSLSVLCSGILGFVIPFFAILAMHIFAGKLKDFFKPKNIFIGIVILSILVLPWHFIMVSKYGISFIKDYLDAYNFLNYVSLKNIFAVIGLFILLFSPWSFSFIWILGQKSKDIINSVITYFKDNSQDKLKEKWSTLTKVDKFLSLNTIVFFTAFIFTLLYGAKYTYLMLFLMFPASCIAGHYWYEYIIKKEHDKSIFFATMIPNLILIICSIIALFGHNAINQYLFHGLNHLILPLIIIFFIIPLMSIFAVILKGRIFPYALNIILMICLSFVITPSIFNFITSNGGENDLIKFAQIASKDNVTLAAFIPSKKYSLVYYYDKEVLFHNNRDYTWLENYLVENPLSYVVVEIKDMWKIEEKKIKYMLLDSGKRYCLIQKISSSLQETEEEEPEVTIY